MNDFNHKQTLLIVDDIPENIDILIDTLSPYYQTRIALNGEKALQIAESDTPPDLILLDVMMPGISGYEVCKQLKENPNTQHIPVIFVTAMSEAGDEKRGLDLGAVDYIVKPVNPAIVLARVKTHLALYDQTRQLELMVKQRTAELEYTRREIIIRLGHACEYKDNETGNHIIRVSHYSRLIAKAHGMSDDFVNIITNAAPMHDVGKLGVSDYILMKPGKLTDDELAVIRMHPQIGGEIIGKHNDALLLAAYVIALTHHEKWDGSGYPNKIKGEDIPLVGRIVAIADVFDALTSVRPYKKAWSTEEAVNMIMDGAGSHFDPDLVKSFHLALPDILTIKEKYDDRLGTLADMEFSCETDKNHDSL
ncbi:MAG: HD domain-containing phosphohydrolase [Methylococcales bacterium]